MSTISVKDADGNPVTIEKPLVPGRAAASASRPVVLSTEDLAAITAVTTALGSLSALASIDTKMGDLKTYTDGLETLIDSTNTNLVTLQGYVDGLETLLGSTNTNLVTIQGYVDGVETLIGATNTALTTLQGYVDGLEGAIGVSSGAAVITDANGTVQQYLRGLVRQWIAGTLVIGAGTNLVGKVDHAATAIADGHKEVTTAGTAVAIAASTAAKFVTIQAYRLNSGYIAVGASTVLASQTIGTGRGISIAAGETITLPIDNLADVFIDATVSGEGVRFTYGT